MLEQTTILRIAIACLFVMPGCSNKPSRVHPPAVDAGAAGESAVVLYDIDSDGALNKKELEKCPGILASLVRYDKDESGTVDAAEITARLDQWRESRIAISPAMCHVTLDGEPLSGAVVKIIPESFMGEEAKPASGTTDASGYASLTLAESDRPPNAKKIRGVHLGVYKVEITHPSEDLPARVNTRTELGYEVSPEAPEYRPVFDVTNR